MKPGDLVMFAWPTPRSKVDDPLDWEQARVGLVIEITMKRKNDVEYGDELLVLHEGERWSVPATWCRQVKDRDG